MDTVKFVRKIVNWLYIFLVLLALIIPFYNLYLVWVYNLFPIEEMIIWSTVVSAVFFIEFISTNVEFFQD